MSTSKLSALIYGSCVSRDLARIDDARFNVGYYLARQSWISAFAERRRAPELPISSAFQKRMVEGDFASTGQQVLRSSRLESNDLILLDLIDERLGVLPYQGSWITWTNELRKAGVIPEEAIEQLVPFGTDQHFELWQSAARRVRDQLDSHLGKTVVIAAKFASHTDQGRELAPFRGDAARVWNARYERYYAELAGLGFAVVDQLDELVVANETHQWGPTPFHYTDASYLSLGDQIVDLIA